MTVRIDLEYSRKGLADAWGTMTVPQGNHEVLRIRYHDVTRIQLFARVFGFWYPAYDSTIGLYSYDWLAEEFGSIAGGDQPRQRDRLPVYESHEYSQTDRTDGRCE